MKQSATAHAVLIGVLIGVVIYGVAKGNFGFLTLIALYLAFRFFTNRKNADAPEGVSSEEP